MTNKRTREGTSTARPWLLTRKGFLLVLLMFCPRACRGLVLRFTTTTTSSTTNTRMFNMPTVRDASSTSQPGAAPLFYSANDIVAGSRPGWIRSGMSITAAPSSVSWVWSSRRRRAGGSSCRAAAADGKGPGQEKVRGHDRRLAIVAFNIMICLSTSPNTTLHT